MILKMNLFPKDWKYYLYLIIAFIMLAIDLTFMKGCFGCKMDLSFELHNNLLQMIIAAILSIYIITLFVYGFFPLKKR